MTEQNTATDDQEAAACADLHARILAALPPGTPRVTGLNRDADPLYRQAHAALDAALDPAHPGRRCPHVRGLKPYTLDMWRAVLSCGQCHRADQLELLPGDEEHRCDRCRALTAYADFCRVIMRVSGFIVTVAMVCPACWRAYTGTDAR